MTAIPHEHATPVPAALTHTAYQAYRVLQCAFVVAPIIAGLDKFFDRLTEWDMYLAPQVNRLLGGHGHSFMLLAGIIEIAAGIGVALKPKYIAWVVAAWLLGIVINLLLTGMFYDVALRDVGLCLAAIALARLAWTFDVGTLGGLLRPRVRA